MRNLLIIFLASLFIFSCKYNLAQPDTSRLAGTWHLQTRIDKTDTGETINEPTLGSDPIALLIYDNLGNMSVQIMKRERDSISVTGVQQSSNNSVAFNGYDAYFGTYSVDTLNHQIKHLVKGAIDPTDVGKELIRNYSISGDTLQLWFSTYNANIELTRTLTWVKELK
jgi:hypothetical protein